MKIAYIGRFKDIWDEGSIATGLRMHGHDVLKIDEAAMYNNKDLMTLIKRHGSEVVLFNKLRIIQQPAAFIKQCRQEGLPTISWTFDLIIGHPARQDSVKTFSFLYADYCFLTDGGRQAEYRALGINKYTLRQGIPDEFAYMEKKEQTIDILFVGTENGTFPYRQRMLRFLKEKYGARFMWVGRDNAYQVRGKDLNTLYAKAKIVIGDCMYAENYWSNRVYETIGRGAFLIHPRVKGLELELTPYKHFVPYDWADFEQLGEKIDYFLERPALRDKIRTAGFQYVKKHYKMSDRCKELIDLYTKLHDTPN